MKVLIGLLFVLSFTAFASIPIGYQTKEIYEAFVANTAADAVQTANIATNADDISTLENIKKNVMVYDLNVTSTLAAAATVAFSDQPIPANSIISNVFYEVETQVVSADDNTIAFACGSTTLDTAADLTDVVDGTIAAGDIVIQTIGGHKNVGAAACTPTITIGAGASGVTAGRVRWFVEYVTRY